ncbi:hypothetical protein HZC00_00235 [Candidatus Kaiserbacteria bacterium]|nr:hypothetical protein [Candidatus Kaiserbacteria bacterium]
MSAGIFKQQVNFVISVFFIGSFGLFMTIKVLDLAQLENPITETKGASMTDINY